ncbi:DNA adenine methylase [Mycoplasma feriruminatoris]|uniref:DNA adenine methylase n=1 Tax=Mycoplasma feriruminatoris TaxID=1179777 RepID=UPI00241FC108|nr:DNA adenine methylase [Mycoplasma feriruminatoris]WFQ94664.1 IS1595 family transposase ISCco4 [Mycoplasma feriruminatoris]
MNNLKFINSPLNYIGSKYKLLNQIICLFPKNIDIFYDLFSGGCSVGINVKANKIIINDINKHLIDFYKFLTTVDTDYLLRKIDDFILFYNLSDTKKYSYNYYNVNSSIGLKKINQKGYLKLRSDYNSNKYDNDEKQIAFYLLIVYGFNNQIRFNKKGSFNTPCGKRDFNTKMLNKLIEFKKCLNEKQIKFCSNSYEEFLNLDFNTNDFIYIDPPYLISTSTYNENNLWNKEQEIKLYNFLDSLNNKNIKFALSNVLEHKNLTNTILKDWSSKYKIHYLDFNYNNSNYQKNKKSKTIEILVTNY